MIKISDYNTDNYDLKNIVDNDDASEWSDEEVDSFSVSDDQVDDYNDIGKEDKEENILSLDDNDIDNDKDYVGDTEDTEESDNDDGKSSGDISDEDEEGSTRDSTLVANRSKDTGYSKISKNNTLIQGKLTYNDGAQQTFYQKSQVSYRTLEFLGLSDTSESSESESEPAANGYRSQNDAIEDDSHSSRTLALQRESASSSAVNPHGYANQHAL